MAVRYSVCTSNKAYEKILKIIIKANEYVPFCIKTVLCFVSEDPLGLGSVFLLI